MTDTRTRRLFRRLDRLFWLIWLGFPLLVWITARQILDGTETIAAMAPDLRPCLESLPHVAHFSTAGQVLFWTLFALEFAVYAWLLALAHLVIHRCATDRALVGDMIGTLRSIGMVITGWAIGALALSNLILFGLARTGDLPGYAPDFAFDLPVFGVGLLMLTMAGAMAQAVALREDADLTI